MGLSLVDVMYVIKAYYNVSKEFAQILFYHNNALYNMKEKILRSWNTQIYKDKDNDNYNRTGDSFFFYLFIVNLK